jgi:hypothetical protein
MGYDPGKVITCRVSPESLMRFLPGQTAPNDSYSIIAWAHLLNAVPDYYQAVIVPVAHDLQKLNPSLLIAELLLCLVGYFGTDPNLYGVNGALGVALPEFFSKNKWCSAWGYTNADGKHINRNIICKKWKFPGMGYALGSEFMRNLKWNGFKIDRHIKRLFSRWIPVLDPIAQKRAAHLTTILGTSLPGELKEFFYYSLLGMAITPRGISYSHADNLIWALGAYVEKKGNESDIIYVQ